VIHTETLRADVREPLEKIATEFGWYIGFGREPDGGFWWVVSDEKTHAVIQSGSARDWQDALVTSILNLHPPSHEDS
jgi:hypothetical protein